MIYISKVGLIKSLIAKQLGVYFYWYGPLSPQVLT